MDMGGKWSGFVSAAFPKQSYSTPTLLFLAEAQCLSVAESVSSNENART